MAQGPAYRICPVENEEHEKAFFSLGQVLHGADPAWREEPEEILRATFDDEVNPFAKRLSVRRWLVCDRVGRYLGRVAAWNVSAEAGAIGFFFCVDDSEAARCLFATAEDWLKGCGAKSVEGPINLGERDRFWGALTSGFEKAPIYLENYNPAYYEALFAANGYSPRLQINTYIFPIGPSVQIAAQSLAGRQLPDGYRTKTFDPSNPMPLMHAFAEVYAATFPSDRRHHALDLDDLAMYMAMQGDLLIPELSMVAFVGERPVGVSIQVSDKNNDRCIKGIVMGVHPDFRESGIANHLGMRVGEEGQRMGYEVMAVAGVSSHSGPIGAYLKRLAPVDRTHTTYMKWFDGRETTTLDPVDA